MSDGKIHIPARRKRPVDDQMVVKVTPEAYNARGASYRVCGEQGTHMYL